MHAYNIIHTLIQCTLVCLYTIHTCIYVSIYTEFQNISAISTPTTNMVLRILETTTQSVTESAHHSTSFTVKY